MRFVAILAVTGFVGGALLGACPAALAEDEAFYCEVLSVDGTATLTHSEVYGKTLQEGDLLKIDDEIETSEGASVDLAFDKDWSNVTRIEEKSRLKVKSVFPTRLYLDKGALYAKLKSLPKDSIFQVETPTAIAAVRGTEYRTEYTDGETSVSNDSEAETSQVYLYEPSDSGELRGEPTVLPRAQFTGIPKGSGPRPARPMNELEKQHCQKARGVIDNRVREQVARGRVSKIQAIHTMEKFGRQMKERQAAEREKSQRRADERHPSGPQDPPDGSPRARIHEQGEGGRDFRPDTENPDRREAIQNRVFKEEGRDNARAQQAKPQGKNQRPAARSGSRAPRP